MRFLPLFAVTATMFSLVSARGTKLTAMTADGPSIVLTYPPALAEEKGFLDVSQWKYRGNGKDKSRSPCPFLNTAANHEILPYSGRKIHAEVIYRLLKKVNLPESMSSTLRDQVKKVAAGKHAKDATHPIDAIDLSDLNEHNVIEHDLSMSRYDVASPQVERDHDADPKLVNDFIQSTFEFTKANGNKAASPAENKISVTAVGMWHNKRRQQEVDRKRKPNEDFRSKFLCSGECFLLLWILGKNGEISGSDAHTFFIDEKFPQGWQAPADMSTVKALKGVAKCAAAFSFRDSWLSWLNKPSQWFGEDSRFGNWWKGWSWSNDGKEDGPDIKLD